MAIISVIVPCYNVENYVGRCIDSIINQSIGINNIELILVNDASTDGTLDVLSGYEQMYPESIMVINCEQNGKQGTARNIGMMYSTGEYITFVDADDCIEPAMLRYMYQCAVQYDCDLVDCYFDAFRNEPVWGCEIKGAQLFEINSVENRKQMLMYTCNREAVWGKLYKRELIMDNAISFPEKLFYEDCFFSQMIAMYVHRYCRTDTSFYHYFHNDVGVMNDRTSTDRIIMKAEAEEKLLNELIYRGLTDDKLSPYHDELEYIAINNILFCSYNFCLSTGASLLATPMYELLGRIKVMFPDFIHNTYILGSEDNCSALVEVLEGLERAKEAARDYVEEDEAKYLKDRDEYIMQAGSDADFKFDEKNQFKCLSDYREEAGSVDAHYFFQDVYAANKVMKSGVRHIYDIGSRIDGYISHLLSMDIKVTMIDIRPLPEHIDNLDFIQGNAMDLSNIEEGSVPVLSCLHALEHFGLGRYGDAVDYYGWKKALMGYVRILKNGGILYLSVPVGKEQKVMFNAHRIYRPWTIVRTAVDDMRLEEFTYFHQGVRTTLDFTHDDDMEHIASILENVADNYLGNYDCGIFTFRKEGQADE